MKRRNTLPALILLVLLAGCLVAVYVTSEPSTPQPAAVLTTASGQADAVGLQLLETANRMAALAETPGERNQAQEALRLADHELDQAFATVTLPAGGDPYGMAEEIGKLVERETDADSAQAAQDWERVTSQYGARGFSPRPAVNLRPSVNGLEVAVRYITRAPQRNAMKSKLFQAIVDLLHKRAGSAPPIGQ